jgi:hypothetical protein
VLYRIYREKKKGNKEFSCGSDLVYAGVELNVLGHVVESVAYRVNIQGHVLAKIISIQCSKYFFFK